jgi:uncharacterized protein YndB with AHSA1/START domain
VFTDPELVAQWWGRGNKLDVQRIEVERGGHWRYVERTPNGPQGFEGRYREVIPPERLVQTFEWDGMPGYVTITTATFENLGDGRTRGSRLRSSTPPTRAMACCAPAWRRASTRATRLSIGCSTAPRDRDLRIGPLALKGVNRGLRFSDSAILLAERQRRVRSVAHPWREPSCRQSSARRKFESRSVIRS